MAEQGIDDMFDQFKEKKQKIRENRLQGKGEFQIKDGGISKKREEKQSNKKSKKNAKITQ